VALAFGAQPWPFHLDLAVAEHDLARLPTIENHAFRAAFALLLRASRYLRGGQLQHRLKDGASGDIDELIAGHPALLDQIYHRQQPLPVLGEERSQLLLVDFPLLAYRVVLFLHGGSPFKVWQPDSTESG